MSGGRRGVAIIIVLVFATVLLTFGAFYINVIGQQRPTNENLQGKIQADFLTQGIAKIALLKFKELPSDFYYAYKKARLATPTDVAPLNEFHDDFLLRGTEPDPQDPLNRTVSWEATYRILSHDQYTQDTIQIDVTATVAGVARQAREMILATRKRVP